MTTKVTIFNHGPGQLGVAAVSVHSNVEPAPRFVSVAPGTSYDQYVHLHQKLDVIEMPIADGV